MRKIFLRICIQTYPPFQQTSMVMDDIAQKAWGFWGKAKNQIEETVATMKAMEDKPQSASELGIVPWENIPEKWADKEEDWIKLVKGVAGDEGTYLYGLDRGLTKQESGSLKSAGIELSYDLVDIDGSSIHPDTLKNQTLADMRFKLVPKWTAEENFWRNLLWKVRELGKTSGLDEARALLAIVNQQREDFPTEGIGKRRHPTESLSTVDGQNSTPVQTKVYQESEEALKLFRECQADSDMSEHLQVAYDSCKDCRESLQKEIDGKSDPAIFSKLLTLSGKLDRAITEYESLQSEKDTKEEQEVKSPSPVDQNEEQQPQQKTSPIKAPEKEVTSTDADASFVKVPTEGASPAPDAEFAALPWDSDSDSED